MLNGDLLGIYKILQGNIEKYVKCLEINVKYVLWISNDLYFKFIHLLNRGSVSLVILFMKMCILTLMIDCYVIMTNFMD